MQKDFKKGDLVVYSGYTDKIEGLTTAHYKLGIVKAVGKYEIFVIEQNNSIFNTSFRVSKECAQVIDRSTISHRPRETKRPKLGDLVLFYNEGGHLDTQESHGVLISKTSIPGQLESAKIRKGIEETTHSYRDLIVLEHNK